MHYFVLHFHYYFLRSLLQCIMGLPPQMTHNTALNSYQKDIVLKIPHFCNRLRVFVFSKGFRIGKRSINTLKIRTIITERIVYSSTLSGKCIQLTFPRKFSLTIRIYHGGQRLCSSALLLPFWCWTLMERPCTKVRLRLDQLSGRWSSLWWRSQYRPLSHNPLLWLRSECRTLAGLQTGRTSGDLI